AMALAMASQRCTGKLTIEGAECVRKSYPSFWQDFAHMGGIAVEET
ncbi:MAG: 3-phosphoshikimate 1-carboxyvinyltransferase, partial [Megasphaera micronuciformis]|nr:3-phosphoshikimate 1-carboxyvinyltransferase [Megasphaera micronuciformis]